MKALFATKVTLNIIESVPFIGEHLKVFIAGDSEIVGAQTITNLCHSCIFLAGSIVGVNCFTFHHDPKIGNFRLL